METIKLNATSRDVTGKKVAQLRRQHLLPAVVYGHGQKSESISISLADFQKAYHQAGTSSLIDLSIDEAKPVKVLLQSPQLHYLSSQPIHADFYAVKMTEKIETAIPIHFVGQSAAVDEQEGNFIANKNELNVKCLPADLIPAIEVDISVLKTFDDQIRVEDLKLPETIEVMDEPDDVIALVTAPRSEEELEAELAEDKVAEAAAVEELGKEETAEGESPEGEATEAEKAE